MCFHRLIALLLLLNCFACRDNTQDQVDLQTTFQQYTEGRDALNIAPLELSYLANLDNIRSPLELLDQRRFFEHYKERLQAFKLKELENQEYYDYKLLDYEIDQNLERIDLEERFVKMQGEDPIPKGGIFKVKMKEEWYPYFLKCWLNAEVSPEELYDFGKKEVAQAQAEIRRIQQQLGYADDSDGFYKFLNADTFFIKDQLLLQHLFEERKAIVQQNLGNLFIATQFPNVRIAKGENEALARVPGYYLPTDSTFYYNIFDRPYNRRNIDWLYLHEAVPGHHYQAAIAAQYLDSIAPFREGAMYMGYIEGWAGYVEGLGKELGLYDTPTAELGSWEWDIVRSVRVVLDIGLNFLGWSDNDALRYWKANIINQDNIARREIKRMRDWPGQVHTYKYGAAQIRRLIAKEREKQGESFNLKIFHERLLQYGALPFWLIEEMLEAEE